MSSNAERLAEAVKARRAELDLNQLEVWQAGGPSNTTQTEIENGRLSTLTRTTARKLDVGLQWEAGSAKAVWAGGDPTPLLASHLSSKDNRALREAILAADATEDVKADLIRYLDERGTA